MLLIGCDAGKMLTDMSSKKTAASSYRRPFGCAGWYSFITTSL